MRGWGSVYPTSKARGDGPRCQPMDQLANPIEPIIYAGTMLERFE